MKSLVLTFIILIMPLMLATIDGTKAREEELRIENIYQNSAVCKKLTKGKQVIRAREFGKGTYSIEWEDYR